MSRRCPVDAELALWLSSPAGGGNFIHAATLPASAFAARARSTCPASACACGRCSALRAVAGDVVAARVRFEPDAAINRIVAGWPGEFDTRRAQQLGFIADESFEQAIRALSATTCRKAGLIMAMYTPIIGLAVAVFALIFLVLRTRVHALIAMLIAASIAGITGGMGARNRRRHHQGLRLHARQHRHRHRAGVMMGRVLEVSGAAEQIAYSFIKWLGKRRGGRWPSPAISSASRFSSIRRSSSFIRWSRRWRKGKRNLLTLGVALAGG